MWLFSRTFADNGKLWIAFLALFEVILSLVYCQTSPLRKKRALNFPEGSTFSVAFCNSYKTLTNDVDIFTVGIQWAVSYNLPNETLRDPDTNRLILRRHRRALYSKLEQAMDSSGVDGRACVERALCETAHHLPPGVNVLAEMLRILFTLPLERVQVWEPPEHHVYDMAHRHGVWGQNCAELYPTCKLSLVDMVMGR